MTKWRIGFVLAALAAGGAAILACTDASDAERSAPPGSEAGSGAEGSTPSEGGPAPDGSASAFCDGTIGVVKRALESCCTSDDKTTRDYALTHGILEKLQPVCTSMLDASITKGRVAFHADQAGDCYAAYATTYGPGHCANITQTYSDPAGTSCRF